MLFVLACTANGQDVQWESFLQAERAGHPLATEDRVWIPTSAGLLEYEPLTSSVTTHNKVTAGLVSNTIEAVAQHPLTSDLYIGTYDLALMVRPQGSTTWEHLPYPESFNTGQGEVPLLYCMAFDEAGVLWVGTNIGLLSYNNGTWSRWENTDSPLYGAVWGLDFSQDGHLLIASHGAFRKEGEELVLLSPDEQEVEEPFFAYGGSAIYEAQDGQLWFFTDLGVVGAYDGENWNHVTHVPQLNIFGASISITEPEPGALRVLAPNRAQFLWDGESWSQLGDYPDWEGVLCQFDMPDGALLTISREELQMEGSTTVAYSNYPFAGPLFQFRNELNGQLWGKAQSSSVMNMATEAELTIGDAQGAPLSFSRYTFATDGSFWCTAGPSVVHQSGAEVTVYDPADSPFPEVYGWELYPGLSGPEVWITNYEDGLYRFTEGEWEQQAHPVFEERYISDIAVVPGGIWATLIGGGEVDVAFWDGSELVLLEQGDQGYEDVPVSDLKYDVATGRLWALGYSSLQYLEDGAWYPYELPFGPSENRFFRELLIQDGRKVIWDDAQVAVETQGEWALYNSINSPMDNLRLTAVGLDANGVLWLSHSHRPIAERVQLESLTTVKPQPVSANQSLLVIGNPVSNGRLMLEAPVTLSQVAQLRLFDQSGKLLKTSGLEVSEAVVEANVSTLVGGWYLAVVMDGGQQYVAPFVVVK